MVSLQRITFVAALLIGVGIATWPSVSRAAPPTSGPGGAFTAPFGQEILGAAKKYVGLKEQILGSIADGLEADILEPLKRSREKEQEIRNLVEEYAPWRQRDSGGVQQLHPVRGTFLIRNDYAQQTLEEDWFLSPQFRVAALHLDVPYDADVKVTQFLMKKRGDNKPVLEPVSTFVRSAGRYRHLVLHNVPEGERRVVKVEASRWTTDPKCDAAMTAVCKKVYLQAGDRRHLAFPEGDFLAMAPPVVGFIVAAAPAPTPKSAKPTKTSGVTFVVGKFFIEVVDPKDKTKKEKVLVASAKYGGSGRTAKLFEFNKATKHTPSELTLDYDRSKTPRIIASKVRVKLKLTWKAKDPSTGKETGEERSKEFYDDKDPLFEVQFAYDAKTDKRIATIPFAGTMSMPQTTTTKTTETIERETSKSATEEKTTLTTTKTLPPASPKPKLDLRGMIEAELRAELSEDDKPEEITVKGEVKFVGESGWLPIDNSFRIIVNN